ncbi:MAG: cation:proton antiporter [Candidatus Methanomethylicia archaeon]
MIEEDLVLMGLLAFMFFVSYLLHFPFDRFHIPSLLAPLLVGIILMVIPYTSNLCVLALSDEYNFLSNLGIMLLIFLIGLRIDVNEFKKQSWNIIVISFLNIVFSTLIGTIIIVSYGYSLYISVLISTALATVAEATVAPILDELDVIRSRSANLILGSGIIDDVLEVSLASLASVIVGGRYLFNPVNIIFGMLTLVFLASLLNRFLFPKLALFEGKINVHSLTMLILLVAITFTVISEYFNLGILLGAIIAGITFQKFSLKSNSNGRCIEILRSIAYGFLGPIFFFKIGLSITLDSIIRSLSLTLLLLFANFISKFSASLIVGLYSRMNWKEIVVVGWGISAKFSMGIIPAQILYSAGFIDEILFTSFIGVSTLTTLIIPFTLSYMVKRWRNNILPDFSP